MSKSDFLSWDNDLDLDAILGEYTDDDFFMEGLQKGDEDFEPVSKRKKDCESESDHDPEENVSKPGPATVSKAKTSSEKISNTYTCPVCSKILKSIAGFRGHTIKQHGRSDLKDFRYQQISDIKDYVNDTIYSQLYESAQEKCLVVCIPQSTSLRNVKITQQFAEMHILRPSPYFKGQYLTFSANGKTVNLDDDGKEIVTGEDKSLDKIKILNEELGYNKDYKPYRILILERPLDAVSKRRASIDGDVDQTVEPKITFVESRKFLRSCTEYNKILLSLDDNLNQFNKNYMVLKDYLDDARLRLQNLCIDVTEKCYKCSKADLQRDVKFRDTLCTSVESYIMGTVHHKMFGVICDKYGSEDRRLLDKCKLLHDIKGEQLGISPEFSCPQPTAIVELANIDCLNTPLEKLHCLKSAVDIITETISSSIEENLNPGVPFEVEKPCLTSDDLIPILVTVIAQAKCSHLHSNMYYIENFHWSRDTKDRDNLSYCLVTFRAAVEYMSNTNFDDLANTRHKVQKEISLDELMHVTKEMSHDQSDSSSNNVASSGRNHSSSQSKLDRQLQKISKIIQESTEEPNKSSKQNEPTSVFGDVYPYFQKVPDKPKEDNKKKKEQLGSFLTSLEDDIFDQSFGKQS